MSIVRTETGEEGEVIFLTGECEQEIARLTFSQDDDGLSRADQLNLISNLRGYMEKLLRSRWYADR